jgi:hypothetical protein
LERCGKARVRSQRESERGGERRYESEKLMDEYGKGDIKMQKTKIK